MTRDEIIATVNRILVEEFELEAEKIRADAHLIDDLELDSLDAVDLVAALEATFGGRIEEGKARSVRRIGDVYALVEETFARHHETSANG